jgi:transcriptional regulator with XRE-family HTH domain
MQTPEQLAGELIRQARAESGLSQAALARRAGLPRSVLNVYERGHRQPAASALGRIVAAAGMQLQVAPPTDQADLERADRLLGQVLDLAEALPARRRGALSYPPLSRLVTAPMPSSPLK